MTIDWPRYARALDLFLGGIPVTEISKILGVSRQRVNQLIGKGRQQLAHRLFHGIPAAEAPPKKGTRRAKQNQKQSEETLIEDIKTSLTKAGFHSLDDRVRALGLPRSTTHHLFEGKHKIGLTRRTLLRLHQAKVLPAVLRQRMADLHPAHLTKSKGYDKIDPERERHADHPPRRKDQPSLLGTPEPRRLQVPGGGNPSSLAEYLQAEPRPED